MASARPLANSALVSSATCGRGWQQTGRAAWADRRGRRLLPLHITPRSSPPSTVPAHRGHLRPAPRQPVRHPGCARSAAERFRCSGGERRRRAARVAVGSTRGGGRALALSRCAAGAAPGRLKLQAAPGVLMGRELRCGPTSGLAARSRAKGVTESAGKRCGELGNEAHRSRRARCAAADAAGAAERITPARPTSTCYCHSSDVHLHSERHHTGRCWLRPTRSGWHCSATSRPRRRAVCACLHAVSSPRGG